MSELTLTVMRLGFLAVLWLFVIVAVQVIRSDLFGTRVTQRGAARRGGKNRVRSVRLRRRSNSSAARKAAAATTGSAAAPPRSWWSPRAR